MSASLFDAGQRLLASRRQTPVPRLHATPLPETDSRVALRCGRARNGGGITVSAASGRNAHHGTDSEGLIGLVEVAEISAGQESPVTALVADAESVRLLGKLADGHATSTHPQVRLGAAIAGWWSERAAHPGTLAVINLSEASAAKYAIGVSPADESAAQWRRWLGVTDVSLAGLHRWWEILDAGPRLDGLTSVVRDDRWLWDHLMRAVCDGRSWQVREALSLAAIRLRSRCDAAENWEAALLSDALWRRRGIFAGTVCEATVATAAAGRCELVTGQLDVRMKVGAGVDGWIGAVDSVGALRFHATVAATSMDGDSLRIVLTGMGRKGSHPVASDQVTLLPGAPSASMQFSTRAAIRSLYGQRRSWIGQEATPTPQRRPVPLDVMVAAADREE